MMIVVATANAADDAWPQFRGRRGLGIASGATPPTHFGPSSNLQWKVNLPSGNSSPCVWKDRLFLTGYDGRALETLCLDRGTGKTLWRRSAPATKVEATHRLGNPATPTPCVDGSRIYAYFGSFGVVAYSLSGEEQWATPLPAPDVEFGTSASPILAGDLLILIRDQDDHSQLLALNTSSGREAWRVERPMFRRSFSSPFLWEHDGAQEIVVPGSIWLKSYEPRGGRELWSYSGTSRVGTTTPVAEGDWLVYASWNIGGDSGSRISMPPAEQFFIEHDADKDRRLSKEEIPAGPVRERFSQMDINRDGYVSPDEWEMMREMFDKASNGVFAIHAGARGNLGETNLAWRSTRSLPYVSSPLAHQGRVFTMKSGGLASCYDLKTGRAFYQDERVGAVGDYYSSAIVADGRIYIGSQSGMMVVLREGESLEVLARNDLGQPVMATPAAVGRSLYVRAGDTLFAFAGGESR
ncbi:MAG: PQQ-binding-like beta-propeller repeat protein [Verrucomicrobia bacterium]|nr:PQQ-binding-like beta-propeller repeat protein [Verrucomicrobiota bacterium]